MCSCHQTVRAQHKSTTCEVEGIYTHTITSVRKPKALHLSWDSSTFHFSLAAHVGKPPQLTVVQDLSSPLYFLISQQQVKTSGHLETSHQGHVFAPCWYYRMRERAKECQVYSRQSWHPQPLTPFHCQKTLSKLWALVTQAGSYHWVTPLVSLQNPVETLLLSQSQDLDLSWTATKKKKRGQESSSEITSTAQNAKVIKKQNWAYPKIDTKFF